MNLEKNVLTLCLCSCYAIVGWPARVDNPPGEREWVTFEEADLMLEALAHACRCAHEVDGL